MLRANGESKKDILLLIGIEGGFAACLGAILGILSVVVLNSTLLRDGFFMPPGPGITRSFKTFIELQVGMALEAGALVLVAGVLGSLLAATKVLRTSISYALRQVG